MLKEREEFYIKLIKESFSYCEVCKKAKIVPTSGNYQTLKNIVKNNNIDISHFKRQRGNKNNKPYTLEEVLTNKRPINSYRLGKMLIKYGLKERKCENPECGLTKWYGKPINVVPHHINGDHNDNRLENIIFLCHNCHSYTDNFSGKNQKAKSVKVVKKTKKDFTEKYKNEIIEQSFICDSIKDISLKTNHSTKTVKKILEENNIYINKNRKKKQENDNKINSIIESLKRTKTFRGTAREFGVSDTAIKKLLIRRGYPKHIKELLNFIK